MRRGWQSQLSAGSTAKPALRSAGVAGMERRCARRHVRRCERRRERRCERRCEWHTSLASSAPVRAVGARSFGRGARPSEARFGAYGPRSFSPRASHLAEAPFEHRYDPERVCHSRCLDNEVVDHVRAWRGTGRGGCGSGRVGVGRPRPMR